MTSCKITFLLLFLLSIAQCKAQKQERGASIISKVDTLPCNNETNYLFRYIEIDYYNKHVANKLNSFLLFRDVDQDSNIYIEKLNCIGCSMDSMVKLVVDSIKKQCLKNNMEQIDHHYRIAYNKNNVLSIIHSWIAYGYIQENFECYNFDLKSGDFISLSDIIKEKQQHQLFKLINNEIEESLKKQINEAGEDQEFFKTFKYELEHSRKQYSLENLNHFVITKNKDNLEGIRFFFSYDYPQASRCYEPIFDLFFSFKELDSYLSKEFKDNITAID